MSDRVPNFWGTSGMTDLFATSLPTRSNCCNLNITYVAMYTEVYFVFNGALN